MCAYYFGACPNCVAIAMNNGPVWPILTFMNKLDRDIRDPLELFILRSLHQDDLKDQIKLNCLSLFKTYPNLNYSITRLVDMFCDLHPGN